MKIKEVEQLNEFKMSPSSLANDIKKIPGTPMIGMEIEVLVPSPEDELQLDRSTTTQDLYDIFPDQDLTEIQNAYDEWLYDQESEWTNEHIDSCINNPDEEPDQLLEVITSIDTSEYTDINELAIDITGWEDYSEIEDELGRDILNAAIKYSRVNGSLEKWDIDEIDDKLVVMYYELFNDNIYDDHYDSLREFFSEAFYNSEVDDDDYNLQTYLRKEESIYDFQGIASAWELYSDEITIVEYNGFNYRLGEEIANNLYGIGIDDVVISAEHGDEERVPGRWIIESDPSIESTAELEDKDQGGSGKGNPITDYGFEVVSPVIPYTEMSIFEDVFETLNGMGGYTNVTTGLHCNVSIEGIDNHDVDYIKLALLLGDQYVLKSFDREFNNMARSAKQSLENATDIRMQDSSTIDVANMIDKMKVNMNEVMTVNLKSSIRNFGKFSSIGLKDNRIEFRSPGNTNYLNDFDKIVETINRFVVVYSIAANPEAYRKEYAKKLYKLFAKGLSAGYDRDPEYTKLFAQYASNEISMERLRNSMKAYRKNKGYDNDIDPDVLEYQANQVIRKIPQDQWTSDLIYSIKKSIEIGTKIEMTRRNIKLADKAAPLAASNLINDLEYYS